MAIFATPTARPSSFNTHVRTRRLKGLIFSALGILSVAIGLGMLVVLVGDVISRGAGWLDITFLTSFDSRFPQQAGIKAAIFGTAYMMFFTIAFSVPLGILSAVYLEEYAQRNWLTDLIQINISNLAGVPSIIYGLLGLEVFVRGMGLGRSVLAGSLTMALLVLPIIIVAAREAIRAVPPSMRDASLAVGSTHWQTVRHHVLPYAMPGILTGTILAASRAIGETAPLITIGALTFVPFVPESPLDRFTVLPIQIFNWVSKPQAEFHELAAAGIIILLVALLSMNLAAVVLRQRMRTRF